MPLLRHRRLLQLTLMLLLCGAFLTIAPNILTADARGGQPAMSLPFAAGEQLVYEAKFSKLLLRGIDIAEFHFTTEALPPPLHASADGAEENFSNQLRITGEAVSKGLFSKLFGLRFRFRFESYVDRDTLLIQKTIKHDEQGKRLRLSEAIFDRIGNKIVWTERDPNTPDRPLRTVSVALDNAKHDIISAFYYLRTQQLTPGAQFELFISDSARVYRVPVRVLEPTRLQTVLGQVSAVRVEMDIFGDDRLVPGNGTATIWLTNDSRHLPVRARITSDIGTLDISLKSVSGGYYHEPHQAAPKDAARPR